MGNCVSTEEGRRTEREKKQHIIVKKRQSQIDFSDMANDNDGGEISEKKFDDLEVAKLKKELFETPEIFVVNNMLLSVQFFEYYEREKQMLIQSSVTTVEKELNPTLLRDETKELIIPDVIFEQVNRNVKFQRHSSENNKIEPLVPRRMFVVDCNVDVIDPTISKDYAAIDKPGYQVTMENCDQQGFVKLKCCPSQTRRIDAASPPPETVPSTSTSPNNNSNELYEYSTLAKVNSPKPIERIASYERRDTLPSSCFVKKKVRNLVENVDEYDGYSEERTEETSTEDEQKPKQDDLFTTVSYISSNGFMKHFQNAVFPNSLGSALGFGETEIDDATAIPGKIFCNLEDADDDFNQLPCEIVPSVAIQWPFDLTVEFQNRSERPTMWDKFGREYRWPKNSMISEIRNLNCALIPKGYIPKRGQNPEIDIQWEVAFPKAQRYLDIHMSHTQIRAFLFLITIYKTFIETGNKRYDGLLIDHIRTHMYWECETNPRDWPEHRLGTKLIKVLNNFIKSLSTGRLPDFFISRRNLFLNVPNKYLTNAQKVFHNVLESPAMYFLAALRNLKYTNNKFYPYCEFRELYDILTKNSSQLISSTVTNLRPPNTVPKNRKPIPEGDVNYRKDISWRIKQERINREKVMQKKKEQELRAENLKAKRRESTDWIDYEWQSEKEFDRLKIRPILIFFIKHFIEMAKRCRKTSNSRQGLLLLRQSFYLATILDECGLKEDAREQFPVIEKEEHILKKMSITEQMDHPPSTPKRNSTQFNFTQQQIEGNNTINLSNLNRSYNNTGVPVKRQTSNLKHKSSLLRNKNEDRRKSGEVRRSVVGFSNEIEVR